MADPDGDGSNQCTRVCKREQTLTMQIQMVTVGPMANDPFPNDPNDGEYSDSDGDGIPDAYDPDFQES